MGQCPSRGANSGSTSQESVYLNCPLQARTPSQMNPVHTFIICSINKGKAISVTGRGGP
jgi:hypothetical protein